MDNANIVQLGRILGDATRVALLDAMFDGKAYTVTELSRHVGAAQSTTSEHLAKMLDAELLAIEAQGRHRYYRLRDHEVAEALERLFEFGHATSVKRTSRVPSAMAYARTCYDHLAGTLAVALTDHFAANGLIEDLEQQPSVTPRGVDAFRALGLMTDGLSPTRPPLRACLDWSERRRHLAGAVPAELLRFMIDNNWFRHRSTRRGLELTDTGRIELARTFGFEAP